MSRKRTPRAVGSRWGLGALLKDTTVMNAYGRESVGHSLPKPTCSLPVQEIYLATLSSQTCFSNLLLSPLIYVFYLIKPPKEKRIYISIHFLIEFFLLLYNVSSKVHVQIKYSFKRLHITYFRTWRLLHISPYLLQFHLLFQMVNGWCHRHHSTPDPYPRGQ